MLMERFNEIVDVLDEESRGGMLDEESRGGVYNKGMSSTFNKGISGVYNKGATNSSSKEASSASSNVMCSTSMQATNSSMQASNTSMQTTNSYMQATNSSSKELSKERVKYYKAVKTIIRYYHYCPFPLHDILQNPDKQNKTKVNEIICQIKHALHKKGELHNQAACSGPAHNFRNLFILLPPLFNFGIWFPVLMPVLINCVFVLKCYLGRMKRGNKTCN